jgi:hypothetical protein
VQRRARGSRTGGAAAGGAAAGGVTAGGIAGSAAGGVANVSDTVTRKASSYEFKHFAIETNTDVHQGQITVN